MAKTSFCTLELLLTYFQKSEELFLTWLARLVSNDDLAFLMEMIAAFLHLVYKFDAMWLYMYSVPCAFV